jgi:hypothetical protein
MSNLQHLILTGFIEVAVLSGALYSVHRAQKSRIYPAFWRLLCFLVGSTTILTAILGIDSLHLFSGVRIYEAYFYVYWVTFAVQSVLMLRVMHEMFRHAVRSIPGVQKIGRPVFFWAIVVSTILALASGITPHGSAMSLILSSAQVLARTQSILALCMVAFLAFASRTLGVSYGSRIFGVTFGFAIMGLSNLVESALFSRMTSLAGAIDIVHEGIYLGAIGLWAVYFLKPEPVRRLVVMPVTSPLMRWNEVAQSLGNPAGQVAVSYPPTFMNDVFHLVNRVVGPPNWPAGASASAGGSQPGPIAS